jgi:hypothetical protein
MENGKWKRKRRPGNKKIRKGGYGNGKIEKYYKGIDLYKD